METIDMPQSTLFECPGCNGIHTASAISEHTTLTFTHGKSRRDISIVPLYRSPRKGGYFYICPECSGSFIDNEYNPLKYENLTNEDLKYLLSERW